MAETATEIDHVKESNHPRKKVSHRVSGWADRALPVASWFWGMVSFLGSIEELRVPDDSLLYLLCAP
jgi:hypothetical protein